MIRWLAQEDDFKMGDIDKPYGCVCINKGNLTLTDNSGYSSTDYMNVEALEHIKSVSIDNYNELVMLIRQYRDIQAEIEHITAELYALRKTISDKTDGYTDYLLLIAKLLGKYDPNEYEQYIHILAYIAEFDRMEEEADAE